MSLRPFTKPSLQRGNWHVVRFCCTSGLCTDCHNRGNHGDTKKRARVVQTDNVSRDWALYVAANWESYGAEALLMPGRGRPISVASFLRTEAARAAAHSSGNSTLGDFAPDDNGRRVGRHFSGHYTVGEVRALLRDLEAVQAAYDAAAGLTPEE